MLINVNHCYKFESTKRTRFYMEILCFDIPVYFMLISKSTIHRQIQVVYALGVFPVRPDAVHCSSKTWHGNSPNMAASKNGPLKQEWLLVAPFGVSIPFQEGGVKPCETD